MLQQLPMLCKCFFYIFVGLSLILAVENVVYELCSLFIIQFFDLFVCFILYLKILNQCLLNVWIFLSFRFNLFTNWIFFFIYYSIKFDFFGFLLCRSLWYDRGSINLTKHTSALELTDGFVVHHCQVIRCMPNILLIFELFLHTIIIHTNIGLSFTRTHTIKAAMKNPLFSILTYTYSVRVYNQTYTRSLWIFLNGTQWIAFNNKWCEEEQERTQKKPTEILTLWTQSHSNLFLTEIHMHLLLDRFHRACARGVSMW